jgi:hypothetical protein
VTFFLGGKEQYKVEQGNKTGGFCLKSWQTCWTDRERNEVLLHEKEKGRVRCGSLLG